MIETYYAEQTFYANDDLFQTNTRECDFFFNNFVDFLYIRKIRIWCKL